MNHPGTSKANIVSQLCAACGLCCNGVLFYAVHLKPIDSVKALSALGLKLKKKQGQRYLLQPCPAHREGSCSIYESRPSRCRAFECRLLTRFASGDIAEADGMQRIAEAKRQVSRLNLLLESLGNTRTGQPLFRRCDHALAEPPDGPESAANRQAMEDAREILDSFLDEHFRPPSIEAKPEGLSEPGNAPISRHPA